MEISVSKCASIREQLAQSVQDVKKAYDSEWNDSVHESFYGYIEELSREVQNIEDMLRDFEILAERVRDIDMEKLSGELKELMGRI